MRAAVYARMSRDAEGDGLGVARQTDDALALIERNGWTHVGTHTDNDLSAYTGKPRPAYLTLLERMKNGELDVVVTWANDRLHRHPRELEDFIDLVEACGVKVVTVTSGAYDLASPEGRAMARVVGAMARAESERKQVRIRRKHQQLADAGLPVGGTRPYGYTSGMAPDGKVRIGMELHPDEAPIVAEAARRVLAGEALSSVVRDLNARGVPTVRGRPWAPTTMRDVLISGRIAGLRTHHGKVVGPGVWPAIITTDDRQRLVAVLTNPDRRTTWTWTRTHCLTGLLWCARCDLKMGSGRRKDKARQYVCHRDATRNGCGRMTSLAEPLEDHVGSLAIAALATDLLDGKLTAAAPADDRQLLDQLREADGRLDQLTDDHYTNGILPRGEYLMARRRLEVRIDQLRADVAALQQPATLDLPGSHDGLRQAWAEGDTRWRQALIGHVIERVVLHPAVKGRNFFSPDRVAIEWRT